MAPRARSVSRSRGLPWQPIQPQRHMKQRSFRGKRALPSNMPAFIGATGHYRTTSYVPGAHHAAAGPPRGFVSHLSIPRVWQPPFVHGCSMRPPWPAKQHQQVPFQPKQQQPQQQDAPKQLKKRLRRAKQRRQQRQRRALARQQKQQHPTLFAPPAPFLDNEFYMARAERERQAQGVRQIDYFMYPAAAAAGGAVDHQSAGLFALAAPIINNEVLLAHAEQQRAAAAAQQPQQQITSSVLLAPLTPAAEEQPCTAGKSIAAAADEPASSSAAAAAPAVVSPFAEQQWQLLEQQLQDVHIREMPSLQQQTQQEDSDDDNKEDFTTEEVCSWFPAVQASLKSTQRVNLPAHVASRQPDAPGFFSVLTRTVSDASSCC